MCLTDNSLVSVTHNNVVSVSDDSVVFVLSQGPDGFDQGGREEVDRG